MSAAERHELEPHATKIAAAARRYLMRNMVANFVDANKTDNEGRGVLHQYACDGLCYAGTLALIRGTDVNLRDKNMQTALHQAAYNSHPHFVCLLLGQLGVEIDDRDVSGWTPLHWSCYVGKADVTVESGTDDAKAVRLANLNAGLRRLKDQGDELNQTRDERRTAVAQALCEAGAAVNAKLWKGWGVGNGSTPLHMAATFGCVSAAQVLIQHGADVTILDDLGCASPPRSAARSTLAPSHPPLHPHRASWWAHACRYTPLFVAVRENQVRHESARILRAVARTPTHHREVQLIPHRPGLVPPRPELTSDSPVGDGAPSDCF